MNLQRLLRQKKKYMCVYCHMSKKSRVGRSALIFFFFFFFFFKLSAKPEIVVPGSGIRYFIFEISGKHVICFMTIYTVFLLSLLSISTTGAWGMDFVSSSPLFSTTPPPLFSKFSYKSFLFQNFHNHSFFLHSCACDFDKKLAVE